MAPRALPRDEPHTGRASDGGRGVFGVRLEQFLFHDLLISRKQGGGYLLKAGRGYWEQGLGKHPEGAKQPVDYCRAAVEGPLKLVLV